MFFDMVLLHHQHRARFGLAWIAGTRGVRYLNKNDVIAIDIGKLCEDIAEFICSQSESPRARFSLRLSSVLINGTMKIYKQKAVFYLDDVVKFMTMISMPVSARLPKLTEEMLFLTPPSPITDIKTKRRRRAVEKETPESQLNQIAQMITIQQVAQEIERAEEALQPSVLQARTDDITLRETQPSKQEGGAVGDFGDFGILSEEDLAQIQDLGIQPLAQMPRKSTAVELQPSQRTLQEIPEEVEVPPAITVTPDLSVEPTTGSKITVEALVHAPASPPPVTQLTKERPKKRTRVQQSLENIENVTEPPVVLPQLSPSPPAEPMEVDIPSPPRQVLQEMQNERIAKRDQVIKVQKAKKKTGNLRLLLITNKPQKIVRIDRHGPEDHQLVDINPCPMLEFGLFNPNFTNCLNLYMVSHVRDVQRGRSDGSNLHDSLTLRRKSRQVTPPVEVPDEENTAISPTVQEQVEDELPITQALPTPTDTMPPLLTSTPLSTGQIQVERGQTEERTREETTAISTEEELLESPRKRRRHLDVQPEMPRDPAFLMVPEIPSPDFSGSAMTLPQESTVDSVSIPHPALTEKVRQQNILNAILQSDKEFLTLEDVCMKPVNKLNVARAFSDLLVLCRHVYVILVNEENSIALKYIGKGPKMIP